MSRPFVTVIVVAHDGGRWLGETLKALASQSYRPDRVVGADNGSRDGSADLLTQALGSANVLRLPRSASFGDAVAEVLGKLPPGVDGEWLWLLHDDCAPDRRALEALLRAADEDRKAAVLGPKLRDWLDRRLLLEIGVTVGRTGRRDTGLEAREFDQGQHDGTREVMAVSTAGMLIRRDVWEATGGLDPFLPIFRDDLDLCWRVRNAGHRVLAVTEAVAWHAEASARRRRRMTVSGDHPRRLDRRNGIFVVMANLPFLAMLWALLRNVAGSLTRTVLFVLGKQPANALDELVALGSVLAHPVRLAKARRARREGRKKGYKRISRLLTPRGAGLRRLTDMVQSFLAGEGPVDSAGRHHHAAPEEEVIAPAPAPQGNPVKRFLGRPGVLLVFGLTLVALVAERSLLGAGRLGGGALVPVTGGAGDLWAFYTGGFHDLGPGSADWAPPYVAVLAALSTLAFGQTSTAVSVLLLGSVPLAGASAYLASRRLVPDATESGVGVRVWVAATYALLPVATGAVASGRLGTAAVLVLLPACAVLAAHLLGPDARRSRRAAWGFGLVLAVGAAFVPLLLPMALVLGVLAVVLFRTVRPGVLVPVAIALGVPVALLLPWLGGLVLDPGRFLLEAGLHDPALVSPALGARDLLTLSPGGPGLPPFWVTGGLLAVALGALFVHRARAGRRAKPDPQAERGRIVVLSGWGIALFALVIALIAGRVGVAGAPAWPGVPLAVAGAALIVLAALSAPRLDAARARGGPRRIAAWLVAAVAFSTPLLAAGHWIVQGVRGPLDGDARDPLPALAVMNSRHGERTLLIRGAEFTVLRGRTPLIGEAELPVASPERAKVAAAAQGLAGGRGGNDAEVLAQHGVAMVAVAPPVGPELARTLDSQPSLQRMSLSDSGGLWRIAEPLTPVPARPAHFMHTPWLWLQGALVLVAVVMAAPGRREPAEEAARTPDPALAGVS
ncbi:glycosyltransferase [Nonomuraea ceibae]|uniref:glycosyltransferase n=1 Tax=Nonomuraea ceibae TaxID=1935170 RepID=UPI001C5D0AAB|nr:glycosyltransferase [Nonomuraea ceibae]